MILTLGLLALVFFLVWFFLVRPLIGKASDVMERADMSYERDLELERLSQEERQKAEDELKQQLGDTPDNS